MNAETELLENTRFDLQVIASWISPGSKVLDLGCGRGDLLHSLMRRKRISGSGIEIDGTATMHGPVTPVPATGNDVAEELPSPVSEQAQALGQRVGILLLLMLMGLAFYNDFMRLLFK